MCSCIVRIAFRRSRLWQLKLRTVQMALKLVMVSTHPLTTPKSNRAIGDGVVPLSQITTVSTPTATSEHCAWIGRIRELKNVVRRLERLQATMSPPGPEAAQRLG